MKSNMKKFLIVLASIMAASFLIAFTILYTTGGITAVTVNSSQIKSQDSFNADEVKQIVIDVVNTDVNVIPVVDKKIGVDFYGSISTNLIAGKPELVTDLKNGVLTISITYPKTITFGLINLANLYLDVYVPNNFSKDIKVSTVSGNLNISKLSIENFNFKSISGNLNADSLSAKFLTVETSSGKVNLNGVEGKINADTISGEVTAVLKSFNNDLSIKTVSGEVNLSLPGSSEFKFKLGSVSGKIVNELGSKITFADSSNLEGIVGEGTFNITIETISGSIKITKE
jgi:lia operon protein LiaG